MFDFVVALKTGVAGIENNLPEIIACMMVFGIPIVAILTSHQRKMAELIHSRHSQEAVNPQVLAELSQLRMEVARLRDTVNQQVLAADQASSYLPPVVTPELHQETR